MAILAPNKHSNTKAQNNMHSDIEAQVCRDIQERQAKGIAKYGTTVAQNPLELRQWLQHSYEECLDQAIYLKRAMVEMERQQALMDQISQAEQSATSLPPMHWAYLKHP